MSVDNDETFPKELLMHEGCNANADFVGSGAHCLVDDNFVDLNSVKRRKVGRKPNHDPSESIPKTLVDLKSLLSSREWPKQSERSSHGFLLDYRGPIFNGEKDKDEQLKDALNNLARVRKERDSYKVKVRYIQREYEKVCEENKHLRGQIGLSASHQVTRATKNSMSHGGKPFLASREPKSYGLDPVYPVQCEE